MKKQEKMYVIPIFVPHLGCPNDCIFCNQKSISGQVKQVTKEDVKKTIDYYLASFKEENAHKEVAFFGGSFTRDRCKTSRRIITEQHMST